MKITPARSPTRGGVGQGPGSRTEDTSGGFTGRGKPVPFLDGVFVRRPSEWLDRADSPLLGRRPHR
ncbi:hypothetical protein L6E12_11985 [Actinokineospora sp. PR83]|uniref:hypothetical protein n=1 Tax=Actinokineospora sp. PR83 TaxID=2884908 RepID=UPI001F1B6284|nr:hypothetical protein [Actinokineospora sp. PR83]MCG8916508.1 hypothetical protein [Actinokineospora sp. PR83]